MTPVIIYFLFFTTILLITIKRPVFIIGGMLSIYVVEQLAAASHPYFAFNPRLTNLMVGGGVVFALFMANTKLTYMAVPKLKVIMFAASIYVYAATSIFWAPDFSQSLVKLNTAVPYIILYLFLAVWFLSSVDDYRTLYKSLIIVGVVLLGMLLISGKLQVGGVRIPWIRDEYGRGTRQNYLEIAKLSGLVMLTSLLSDVWERSKLWKIIKWLVAILCVAVSIKAGARGQTIFALLVLGIFLPLRYPIKKIRNLGVFVVLLPLLAYIFIIFLDAYWGNSNRWSSDMLGQNAGERFDMASALLSVWYDGGPITLLLGLGNSSSFDIVGFYPHIVPLEILAEEGLLGSLLFLWIIYIYFSNLLYLYRKSSSLKYVRGVVIPLGAMFLYSFLLIFKQGSLLGSVQLFYYGSMIMILKMVIQHQSSSIKLKL